MSRIISDDLKPCPFCSSQVEGPSPFEMVYHPPVARCPLSNTSHDLPDWNRRPLATGVDLSGVRRFNFSDTMPGVIYPDPNGPACWFADLATLPPTPSPVAGQSLDDIPDDQLIGILTARWKSKDGFKDFASPFLIAMAPVASQVGEKEIVDCLKLGLKVWDEGWAEDSTPTIDLEVFQAKRILEALRTVQPPQPVADWISVEDISRLPVRGSGYDWVLVRCKMVPEGWIGVPHIAELVDGKWHDQAGNNDMEKALSIKVIEWMPIPGDNFSTSQPVAVPSRIDKGAEL